MSIFFVSRCLICGVVQGPGDEPLCSLCWASLFRGVLPPPAGVCVLCGQTLLGELSYCADCCRHTWSFTRLEGLVPYQSSTGALLRAYKGRSQTSLARFWAQQALSRLLPPAPLVPVPVHRGHLRKRGWDPVGLFCRHLSAAAKVSVLPVLARRSTASQKTLGRKDREANAQKSYRLRNGAEQKLEGLPLVWLVDDVVTTGSTVEACARELLAGGVAEVRVFCLCLH